MSKKKKVERSNENHEAGLCPKCKSMSLSYGSMEVEDGQIYYEVTCDDCGFEGKEWYELTFIEYRDADGEIA